MSQKLFTVSFIPTDMFEVQMSNVLRLIRLILRMVNLKSTQKGTEFVKKVIVINTYAPLLEKLSPPGPRAGFCHPGHHRPCNCDVIFEGKKLSVKSSRRRENF